MVLAKWTPNLICVTFYDIFPLASAYGYLFQLGVEVGEVHFFSAVPDCGREHLPACWVNVVRWLRSLPISCSRLCPEVIEFVETPHIDQVYHKLNARNGSCNLTTTGCGRTVAIPVPEYPPHSDIALLLSDEVFASICTANFESAERFEDVSATMDPSDCRRMGLDENGKARQHERSNKGPAGNGSSTGTEPSTVIHGAPAPTAAAPRLTDAAREPAAPTSQPTLRHAALDPIGENSGPATPPSIEMGVAPERTSPRVPAEVRSESTTESADAVTQQEFQRLLANKRRMDSDGSYIGESLPILRVFEAIAILNRNSNAPMLVLGPSGAGKSEIAELIHRTSGRAKGPFHREQASSSRGSDYRVVQGDWVGFAKDSGISGIPREGKTGLLEEFAGGTIFVDELADMHSDLQGLMRDILQYRPVPKVGSGGKQQFKPDVRIIFATNVNPEEAVQGGRLRHDLLYRIGTGRITIPSLETRKSDIVLFARAACPSGPLDPRLLLALLRHSWPKEAAASCSRHLIRRPAR